MSKVKVRLLVFAAALLLLGLSEGLHSRTSTGAGPGYKDPGVRTGNPDAGGFLPGLTPNEEKFFQAGQAEFEEAEGVGDGLGPRFNLDSCGGCHMQPAIGGTSPAVNPQVAVATASGAKNKVPSFITLNGPIREARFQYKPDGSRDGGVHSLFVISGRADDTGTAAGCTAVQENFEKQVVNSNIIFRIPTPTFGAGLIEQVPDQVIIDNMHSHSLAKQLFGIFGRPNRNGNDGTITRFGWKAQNKSLQIFSGEAYNVEMGITSEEFQQERDENPTCQFATVPNTVVPTEVPPGTSDTTEFSSAVTMFSFFMRFLAPPTPSTTNPGGPDSISRGRQIFANVGCVLCHTPRLNTGRLATVEALRNQDVNLFSDLLVHNMGPGLADDIVQGGARGDEFRTAPLWGLGKRIFFLHDGRTTDLVQAILAHSSSGNSQFGSSEANTVIFKFKSLGDSDKQHLLNFLRSL
jgi:CxxC motif-containing protein (DUF1111 family)